MIWKEVCHRVAQARKSPPSTSTYSSLLQRFVSVETKRRNHTSVDGDMGEKVEKQSFHTNNPTGCADVSKWKKFDARDVGIARTSIPPAPWTVLKILQLQGHEVYLVGGCVRDLLLKRTPKDFDVVTTANLKQIKNQFNRCTIVGSRFPICLVHIKGSTVEVSSFCTSDKSASKKVGDKSSSKRIGALLSQLPSGCDKMDLIRFKDCMRRDFTVNSLFYDPFGEKIYDYSDGMHDLKLRKVRTVTAAHSSFQEDCARILRGIKIAGRLGLRFSKDTSAALCDLSSSIRGMNKSRLLLETNSLLCYGAAESSFRLLQEYKLLQDLLPIQAAYLNYKGGETGVKSPNLLMDLLGNMDKVLAPDRPCHISLWVGLLAFHSALVYEPQDAIIVWVFCLALHHGDGRKSVKLAKDYTKLNIPYVCEILQCGSISDEELWNKISEFTLLIKSCLEALTNTKALPGFLGRYPSSKKHSCLGISKGMKNRSWLLFENLDVRYKSGRPEGREIEYGLLGQGATEEVRFVLGKIIMQTLLSAAERKHDKEALSDGNRPNGSPSGCSNGDVCSKKRNGRSVTGSKGGPLVRPLDVDDPAVPFNKKLKAAGDKRNTGLSALFK